MKNSYPLASLIMGLVIGAVVGFASLNMIKKSQRDAMLPFTVGICAIGFAGIGFAIGNKAGKEVEAEFSWGHDKAQDGMFQHGRGWVGVTEWTDKNSNSYKHHRIARQYIFNQQKQIIK